MLNEILTLYGIPVNENNIQLFGDGLINRTWKVTTNTGAFILQNVNDAVFKTPQDIDQNISGLKAFLKRNHPNYHFVTPIPAISGETLVHTPSGYFRLFPFVENSHALNVVKKEKEAFEAAKQFGKLTRLLDKFKVHELKITLPDFHNLSQWYNKFLFACENAPLARKQKCSNSISFITENASIVSTYEDIAENAAFPKRVIHHDTKINNVLFDEKNEGICVIDLDTIMPGYFISDVGDMMRTYLCSVSEEETDLTKINIRKSFFKAIYDGYMQEMGDVLTAIEKDSFIYAGKFLIFMQAIRFLTDYLQNDIYYGQKYEGHNLNRAVNQLTLLKKYLEAEDQLRELITTPVVS